MSSSIIIRVFSKAGRSRLEFKTTDTIGSLKQEISKRQGVEAQTLKIFTDQACKRALGGRDSDTIAKVGLKNGDTLHIANADAQLTNIVTAQKFKSHEEIKQEQEEKAKDAPVVDSKGQVIKQLEKTEDDGIAKDSRGQKLAEAVKEEKTKAVSMINKNKLGDDTGD